MTFTFLGQPKVDVACIPLARKGLNIMDLPLISNFVQSAVDAAMAVSSDKSIQSRLYADGYFPGICCT